MRPAAPLLLSLLLASAAHAQENGPPAYTWSTASNGTVHYLRYQTPAGEGALELQCIGPRASQVTVRVYSAYTGDGPEPRRMTLASGAARSTVRGRMATADPDPSTFMADVPLAAPVFTGFRRTGDLDATVDSYGVEAPALSPAERQAVSQFLNRCRGR